MGVGGPPQGELLHVSAAGRVDNVSPGLSRLLGAPVNLNAPPPVPPMLNSEPSTLSGACLAVTWLRGERPDVEAAYAARRDFADRAAAEIAHVKEQSPDDPLLHAALEDARLRLTSPVRPQRAGELAEMLQGDPRQVLVAEMYRHDPYLKYRRAPLGPSLQEIDGGWLTDAVWDAAQATARDWPVSRQEAEQHAATVAQGTAAEEDVAVAVIR